MNRQQRRAAKRRAPKKKGFHTLTKEQLMQNLVKNGITPQDLEKAYEDGLRQGLLQSGLPLIRSFYAALCLALQELHGFGPKRCYDVLTSTDQHITDSLCSAELVEEVLDRLGLEIDIHDVEGHVSQKARNSA